MAALMLVAVPATASAGQLKAGAAVLDASWHVGASAGQYASDGSFVDPANDNYDPTAHSTRRASSYGRQSDLQVRALVVEGPDGKRTALVKNDFYIPQDLIWRRTAQILAAKNIGIDQSNLTMAVSHNHSSPFYSSTAWGVWTFQDVFDIRFYAYYAERMASVVEKAAQAMKPVRVGASVSQFDKTHRHSFGPAVADDGTPAGYPQGDTDHDMTVVRFDDISDPANPKPLANLINFGLHPEFLEGNDLISGDYVAPLQAITDEATDAVNIWTQSAVGTSEPERSTYHSIHERLEFSHKEYGQAEYGARLMANSIIGAWRDVERGKDDPDFGGDPDRLVAFRSDFANAEVKSIDRWFPGPVTHPYPGVSNCKSAPAFTGDPRLPVVGLPDCVPASDGLNQLADLLGLPDPPDVPASPVDPGIDSDDLDRLGIPFPANYAAPGYTGLEEDIDVHLQAFRIGDILFTVCSCEQWADQSRNIETRTDRVAGNEYLGYDWKAEGCTKNNDGTYGVGAEGYGTGTWTCKDPRNLAVNLPALTDQKVERMHRQVTNPANGWNDVEYAPQADAEPADVREIKGNYTHDDRCGAAAGVPEDAWDESCEAGETSPSAARGYKLTVPISMANDYNGYIATYREFQRGDHYRKALTAWGPHSSDYMASRLVNMGRVLAGANEPTLLPAEFGAFKVPLDIAVNDARAQALGTGGGAAIAAYEAELPDDGGIPGAATQPGDVERFDGTFFTWVGGSNFTDAPRVTVERSDGQAWRRYDAQAGEIPITLDFPSSGDTPAYETGGFEWRWTAHFEAFAARFETVEGNRATPPGTYRFVVVGKQRKGGAGKDYRVESQPFEVKPWSGITVEDLQVDPDGRASFKLGPRSTRNLTGPPLAAEIGPIDYPDSYTYPGGAELPRFIKNQTTGLRDPAAPADPSQIEWFCFTCSFRPWIDSGDADDVGFTVTDGAATETVSGHADGDRWVSDRALTAGEAAYVGRGCARDGFGNFNGAASSVVGAAGATASESCPIQQGPAEPPPGGPGPGPGGTSSGPGGPTGGGSKPSGCTEPSGRLRGKTLGRGALGRTRARNRAAFLRRTLPRRVMDRFCLADGRHQRVGYPSAALLRTLSARERRRVRGRAVFTTSSSTRYSALGRRPGSSSTGLGGRRFRVGANVWVLRRGSRATVLFKVRRGRVLEVGLGDRALTRGSRAVRYLRSFS
jgi:hypothetical protein